MFAKVFVGLLATGALTLAGVSLAPKSSEASGSCCYPGAACCEAGLPCCESGGCCGLGACCVPGAACCDTGACCGTAACCGDTGCCDKPAPAATTMKVGRCCAE